MPKGMIRQRAARLFRKAANYLSPVWGYGQWTTVHETTTGTWQQHVEVNQTTVTANWAVWSCASLISGDIAKMPAEYQVYDERQDIWKFHKDWALLRKPNRYQTWIEFSQNWDYSQLLRGNTYVLKQRDRLGEIVALYILDPCRVTPLVTEDGGIYYQLASDNLSQLKEPTVIVPASEIIHDRYKTPWHPLIGVSPIYACGVAATQGLAIQDNSTKFFENMSRPGGVLTAPGNIPQATIDRLKTSWQDNYSGDNAGKVAILGDGLSYQALNIVSAADSQLLEQLKFSGEMVCAAFHVPPYKLGLGQMPTVSNTGTLNQQYYDQALQYLVQKREARLTEGLELRQPNFRISLDESVLLRMDPAARYDSHSKAIGGGWRTPNEARRDEDLPPVEGGDTCYMQQQSFSLAALNKRDQQADPFGTAQPPAAPALPAPSAEEPEDDEERMFADLTGHIVRGLAA
jgi:HK97 family phage portal protein